MRAVGGRHLALLGAACAAGSAAAAVEYEVAPGSSASAARRRVVLRPWAAARLLGGANQPTGRHLALLRPELADHFTEQVIIACIRRMGIAHLALKTQQMSPPSQTPVCCTAAVATLAAVPTSKNLLLLLHPYNRAVGRPAAARAPGGQHAGCLEPRLLVRAQRPAAPGQGCAGECCEACSRSVCWRGGSQRRRVWQGSAGMCHYLHAA